MAIKIGHASIDERGKASGGTAGDQTGGEVCIRSWYSSPWDTVLRPLNSELAEKSAKACEAACANKHIGYDQNSRNTLYRYAKLVNFDLSKITDDCECDCSSLMHVCAIAGGAKLSYGVNGLWTGNLASGIMASGQYGKLTASKYLTSDAYLKRGDILLRTSGHTAMVLEDGAMASGTAGETAGASSHPTATMLTPLPLLKKGHKCAAVGSMQTLLVLRGYDPQGVDSDFGDNTDTAVKAFQKDYGLKVDGECGEQTWQRLISG